MIIALQDYYGQGVFCDNPDCSKALLLIEWDDLSPLLDREGWGSFHPENDNDHYCSVACKKVLAKQLKE